ncbi:unnamed protein product, partial [Ixodes hexagonus]
QVSATDKDTGNNARLTFKLLEGRGQQQQQQQQQASKFGIFPNNGFLYLKEPLDRESADHHTLTVEVVDNGSPALSSTATVQVRVLDANDNDPMFEKPAFEFFVPEDAEKGRRVGTVSAHDKDAGSNAALRYSLVNANGSFQINPVTGEIFTKVSLDRETKSSYEVTAEVHDQGTPPRSHRAVVKVIVADVNDNAPVFVEPAETLVGVREEQPVGTELAQVQAVDADEGKNAEIFYEIVQGELRMDV